MTRSPTRYTSAGISFTVFCFSCMFWWKCGELNPDPRSDKIAILPLNYIPIRYSLNKKGTDDTPFSGYRHPCRTRKFPVTDLLKYLSYYTSFLCFADGYFLIVIISIDVIRSLYAKIVHNERVTKRK